MLIFEFIKLKSIQGAKNVVWDIVAQSKNIYFVEQYQADEFLGEPYRRMIVRDYNNKQMENKNVKQIRETSTVS